MTLTISIPTFNRANKLEETLKRITSAIAATSYDVRIFISDNASTDNTQHVIQKWMNLEPRITSQRNANNLGLIGNYRKCVEGCKSEYIWVCGDDDGIHVSAVAHVVAAIKAEPTSGLYLLNYRRIDGRSCSVTKEAVLDAQQVRGMIGTECFTKCMEQEFGCGMFITACVLRTAVAAKALNSWRGNADNLSLPLFVSGYAAARQGMTVVQDVCFDGVYGAGSWKSRAFQVFMLDMPAVLKALIDEQGYNSAVAAQYIANAAKYFAIPRFRMIYSPGLWWRAFRQYRLLKSSPLVGAPTP